MDGWIGGWVAWWPGGWMGGWEDGWLGGWMGGWLEWANVWGVRVEGMSGFAWAQEVPNLVSFVF